ncbi:MAG: hypothetical protein ACI8QF_004436 [Limisphaerales bacterium]|jgi:hypothetical protein
MDMIFHASDSVGLTFFVAAQSRKVGVYAGTNFEVEEGGRSRVLKTRWIMTWLSDWGMG